MIGSHVPPPWSVYVPDPVADHPLNFGLIAWWLAVPATAGGATWYDLCGRWNSSIVGNPSWIPSESGPALLLDGDDYVQTSVSDSTPLLAAGTITWQMRPSLAWNDGTIHTLWGAYGGTAVFGAQKYSDGNLYIGWENPDRRVVVASSSTNYAQNLWNSYALTWSTSGSILYHNGNQIGSNLTPPTTQAFLEPLKLGFYSYGSIASLAFRGGINDFRLQSRDLDGAEVAMLYLLSRSRHAGLMNRWRPTLTTIDSAGTPITLAVATATSDAANSVPIAVKGPLTRVSPVVTGDGVTSLPTVLRGPVTRVAPAALADALSVIPAVIRGPLTRSAAVAAADGLSVVPPVGRGPLVRTVPVASSDVSGVPPARLFGPLTRIAGISSADITPVTPIIVSALVTVFAYSSSTDVSGVNPTISPSAKIVVPALTTVNVSAAVPAVLHTMLMLAMPSAVADATGSAPVPAGTILLDLPASVAVSSATPPDPVPAPVILDVQVATDVAAAIAPAVVPGLATPLVPVAITAAAAASPTILLSLLSLPPGGASTEVIAVIPDVPGGPVTRVPGVVAAVATAASPAVALPAVDLGVPVSQMDVDSIVVNVALRTIALSVSVSHFDFSSIPPVVIPYPVSLAVASADVTMITTDTELVLPFLIIPVDQADASALATSPDADRGIPPLVPGAATIDGIASSPDLVPSGVALVGVPVASADIMAAAPGIEAELAESLTEAVIRAFHAGPLAVLFGEVNPDWRPKIRVRKAFAGDEPPYVVLAGGEDARARGESPDADGNSYPIEESTFQATVYATSDGDARDLGEAFSDYMIGQSDRGALRFAGGTVMLFGRVNPYQAPFRDPEEGPNGTFIYGQVLRFRVIIGA